MNKNFSFHHSTYNIKKNDKLRYSMIRRHKPFSIFIEYLKNCLGLERNDFLFFLQ